MNTLDTVAAKPIPVVKAPVGWKEIAIQECREPLIALSTLKDTGILVEPQYFRKGLPGAIEEMYVREGIAQKLTFAASQLLAGYRLLVWDAWRPLSVQKVLFDGYYQILREQFPTLSEEELRDKTQTYVSLPSKHVLRPSPHYTGGAVDLTIADAQGYPLPMGTEFDTFSSAALTRSLEERIENGEHLSQEEKTALHHRRFLYHTMIASGFTNYCEEWWHYNNGDQMWAEVSSNTAFYGGIEP